YELAAPHSGQGPEGALARAFARRRASESGNTRDGKAKRESLVGRPAGRKSAAASLRASGGKIVVVAAHEGTGRHPSGHVLIDPQILGFVPIGRDKAALSAFGSPGELVVLATRLEFLASDRGNHVRVGGEVERFIPARWRDSRRIWRRRDSRRIGGRRRNPGRGGPRRSRRA